MDNAGASSSGGCSGSSSSSLREFGPLGQASAILVTCAGGLVVGSGSPCSAVSWLPRVALGTAGCAGGSQELKRTQVPGISRFSLLLRSLIRN